MLRKLAVWSPTILLALIVVTGLTSGAGVEPVAAAGLVAIQAAVIGLPRAAEAAGRWYGERTSEPAENERAG